MATAKKATRKIPNLIIENAIIRFRNFSGKAGRYNVEGQRNFCIFLEPTLADTLRQDGWNIKFLKPKDPVEPGQDYVQVKVDFSHIPPQLIIVTKKNKTRLSEASASVLDYAEIAKVDLTINPYYWEVNGKSGIKAYLKAIYVTIVEDPLADKYQDVPDSAVNAPSLEDEEDAA